MNPELPDPERWSDLPQRSGTAERELGALFRRVKETTESTETARARAARRSHDARGALAAQVVWRAAVVVVVLLAMGSVVGAALYRWRFAGGAAGRGGAAISVPSSNSGASHAARRVRAQPVEPPVEMPDPLVEGPAPPEPVASAPAAPRAARRRLALLPPDPAPRPPGEADALATVFHDLRSTGDAAAALRSLDEYERRFPAGALRNEARIARAEALLALDRRRDALPLLDGLEEAGEPPTREVRITRGELLAESGRCPQAVRDFDAVLAPGENDSVAGRALFGRASCRLRTGQGDLARQDLARYLLTHPDGPFAAAARRALGLPPP
jgi:hypothetical protein